MRPVLPSYKSISGDRGAAIEASHSQRAQRRTRRFSSILEAAADIPSQTTHKAMSSVVELENCWCILEPLQSLNESVSGGPVRIIG